jgi:hypothetical protein
MLDWLTEKLGVDEAALRAKAGNLLDL